MCVRERIIKIFIDISNLYFINFIAEMWQNIFLYIAELQ